eukprot:UN09228
MSMSTSCLGNFALSLVSFQVGIQPFLTEKYVPRNGIKSSIVIIQELVKTICCLIVLIVSANLFTVFSSWTLKKSLRVALIPALIYCIQNVLAYYAYLQLDPLTYNLINQSKIIFAAIFLKLILNQTPTMRQMVALTILFISSILLTADSHLNEMQCEHIDKDVRYGCLAIITASIMSGLAGTLTQKALQAEECARNSLLFSMELAVYGVLFSLFRLYLEHIFS